MAVELEIVQMALKLMEIDYTNWNTCLEHCSELRLDRMKLSHYVKIVEEELEKAKVENND